MRRKAAVVSVVPSFVPEWWKIGAPEEIRTPDPQIRSLVLYPAELRARLAIQWMIKPITAIRQDMAALQAK